MNPELPSPLLDAPADLATALRTLTRLQVAAGRALGQDDDTIRVKVSEAFQEAVTGDRPWTRDVDLGRGPEPVVSTAGMFRMVFEHFGLDRGDPHLQERWWRMVAVARDEALAERFEAPGGR